MSSLQASSPPIPESAQQTLRKYLKQLRPKLEAHIEGVILYGSLVRGEYVEGHSNINLLLVVNEPTLELLQHCGHLTEKWQRQGVVPPLVLTEQELCQSVEYFPLEYFEIKDNHLLLEGRDPLETLHVNDHYLLLQCLQELHGNLFRFRQRFIEGFGNSEAIRALLPLSLTALLPCLRGLCRVFGQASGGTSEAFLRNLPHTLQVENPVFLEVLEAKQGLRSPGRLAWPGLFQEYVRGLEEIITCVRENQQRLSNS